MKNKKIIFLFLVIISAFLGRNSFSFEPMAVKTKAYRHSELKASNNHHQNSKLVFDQNAPSQVLHYRIARSVHFIKSLPIITGSLLGFQEYSKHTFPARDEVFTPFAELLLFPHHAFW